MDQNLDEQTRRDLEQELQVEIYPGTEVMVDVQNHHFVKSFGGDHTVLVPQPSDSANDPLNWSPTWKFFAVFSAMLVSVAQGLGPIALAPMFPYYMKEFNRSLPDVVQFTGITILILGFSNFIWIPIQSWVGRRPVMIISTLICLGSSIWKAEAASYSSFLGACVLNGFGAGPCESTPPTIIADVIFLHDRGKYQTLYFAVYLGALQLGSVFSGHMAQHTGVKSFWWLNAAVQAFAAVFFIFLFPETRFKRGPVLKKAPETPETPDHKDSEIIQVKANNVPSQARDSDLEKDRPSQAQQLDPGVRNDNLSHAVTHDDPWLGRGKPARSQWRLFQPFEENSLLELWLPWKIYLYPIVQFAAMVVAWSCSSSLTLNLTQSQVYAGPPFHFTSSKIGLFNLAIFVGVLIGLCTAGPLSDLVAKWLTKRNNGIREPEMRLPAMIPYIIFMIIGNVIAALGYQHHWDWKVTVIIGYTCTGIQLAALPSIASTYAVDSYKPVAGPLFVAITVNKNVWAYGFSKYLTKWTLKSGFIKPIMLNMTITTIWCLCGIIFWFYGKTFRKWTRSSRVHTL